MLQITIENLQSLWTEIVGAAIERYGYLTTRSMKPVVRPPATAKQLAALEQHWGFKLPPSYQLLLSIFNGAQRFTYTTPLLSTSQIIGVRYEWETVEELAEYLVPYVIAGNEETDVFIALDPTKPSQDGEFEVAVFTTDGAEERFPDIISYMRAYLAALKEAIERERADRAGLT